MRPLWEALRDRPFLSLRRLVVKVEADAEGAHHAAVPWSKAIKHLAAAIAASHLPALYTMTLAGMGLSPIDVKPLLQALPRGCPKLVKLVLDRNNINIDSIRTLKRAILSPPAGTPGLRRLTVLSLSGNPALQGKAAIKTLSEVFGAGGLEHLVECYMSDVRLSLPGLAALVTAWKAQPPLRLRKLSLSFTLFYEDEAATEITALTQLIDSRGLPRLESLKLHIQRTLINEGYHAYTSGGELKPGFNPQVRQELATKLETACRKRKVKLSVTWPEGLI